MTVGPRKTAVGPQAYAAWRATALGAVTEDLEQGLVFELLGDVACLDVLDIGCGDGALACALVARGAKVVGMDADRSMLAAARGWATATYVSARFEAGRAEALPFADASFDVVTAVTVLCFVPDARKALREMARVLRSGGRLVLGELGRWSLWATARRMRGWLGSATWKSARFRDAAELRLLARAAGLTVTATRGAIFYPPSGWLARVMAPFDPWLGQRTMTGAGFIALAASRPNEH